MAEAAAVHQFNSILLGGRGGTVSFCFWLCLCLCFPFISISRSLCIGYGIYGPCEKGVFILFLQPLDDSH